MAMATKPNCAGSKTPALVTRPNGARCSAPFRSIQPCPNCGKQLALVKKDSATAPVYFPAHK
jgi:predicted amidophosphoribosyltransferase